MSIYSANRYGSYGLNSGASITENYSDTDCGRILYESAVNDMKFFDAIMKNDFMQLRGLREGTLLESEIRALDEASVKSFFEKLRERLKQFWEKIKSAITSAIHKIAAYVLHDCKGFLKDFDKAYNEWDKSREITVSGKMVVDVKAIENGLIKSNYSTSIIKGIISHESDPNNSEGAARNKEEAEEWVKSTLRADLGLSELPDNINDAKAKYYDKIFEETEFSSKDSKFNNYIEIAKNNLKDGKTSIKGLQNLKKDLESNIKAVQSELVKAEKQAAKDNSRSANITDINMAVSAYERGHTAVLSIRIKAAKAALTISRKFLSGVMAQCKANSKRKPKDESASVMYENAIYLAEAESDLALGDDSDPETDEDVEEYVDSLECSRS